MALPGVLLLEVERYCDQRGYFAELFKAPSYGEAGIGASFVQDNWSHSRQGVIRGLHIQPRFPQGKLVTVCQGHIWDVVVDVNPASETYGHHVAVDLFGFDVPQAHQYVRQLWIPPGYAHGFCVLSSEASVFYKCTEVYHPEDECGVLWSDGQLGVSWPVADPLVSERDRGLCSLADWTAQWQAGRFGTGEHK